MFNQAAAQIATEFNVPVLRQFDSLLPLVDKMCDNAHYTAKGAMNALLYQITFKVEELRDKVRAKMALTQR